MFRYEREVKLLDPEDENRRADETRRYMRLQAAAPREGVPNGFALKHLRGLRCPWRTPEGRGDPKTDEWWSGERLMLKTEDRLEDDDKKYPLPHAIVTILAVVRANDSAHSLTHELRAIVRLLMTRTARKPRRNSLIQPVLLICYMGLKHSRIVPAHHDGKQLILQYSQLWSFEDEETAPVELFLRYYLSEPASMQSSALYQSFGDLLNGSVVFAGIVDCVDVIFLMLLHG